ncbi:MAG: 16S rRNA (uracil(1498)-N(3))-methyltransferase [Clostridiales bacterium]|nr:16S rRNA (uracil(1498)-N(3))-methyltransferase [Clostridiales bacterium]
MPRFFLDLALLATAAPVQGEQATPARVPVTGADARHIRGALRMRCGDRLTLCDGAGNDYFCEITGFGEELVELRVLYRTPTVCEPTVKITLYQGLPKADKMEWIIQKAVELGVSRIVPVETARCVARLSGREEKKQARWQRIADEAAGQCGRGMLPPVHSPLDWRRALEDMTAAGLPSIVCYEGGGEPLSALVTPQTRGLSLFIGPEGGFEPEEVEALKERGARAATLGKRILRCETAPLAALAALMTLTGNL